ncbi:MAG: Ig-like domain-containing protein [Peptococcaceae bacterium]|nr:Ig-like domain-containing protein [Peptococcaceae bacterium]
MKRNVWKKFASFALTLAMLLSLLPVTPAMAADVPLSCTTSTAYFTAFQIFGSIDLGNYLGNGGLTQPVCGSIYATVTDMEGDIGPYSNTDAGNGRSYSNLKAYSNDSQLTFTFSAPGVYSFYVYYYDEGFGNLPIDKSVEITYTGTTSAPTVTTAAPTGVTSTGATLNGTVNAGGASTAVTFEYGTTASYGSTVTAAQSPLTGSSNTEVNASVAGLDPNTIYHYRVKGTNTGGTATGEDMTFTTDAAEPVITSIFPNSGPTAVGTSVTITGTNFTGATAVKFGSADAASYTVDSATQITAVSPAGGTGTVDITVTTAGGTSATSEADQFTYIAAPEINIQGNATSIADGDATPSTSDHTDFDSVTVASGTVVRTFIIQNTGAAALSLTGSSPYVTLSGTNAADFSITSPPSSSIAAGGSTAFQITFDPSATGLRTASVSIANNDGDKNPYTFSIQGTGTNTAPAVPGLPTDISLTEDTLGNVDLSAATFSDDDNDALTVTLAASAGTFTSSAAGSVTVEGSGTGTLTLSGTAANINAFLDTATNIKYTGAADANGDNAATITVYASDGTVNPLLGTVNINISAVNDNPGITGLPTDISVTENTASNIDLSAASFADVDAAANSITLTLTAGAGTLSAAAGGGVTVTGSGSAALTLTGTAESIDTYLNAASNIKYTGAINAYGNNVTTLTLTANDAGFTGSGGGTDVTLGTVNIDITAIAPTITGVTSVKTDGTYGIGEAIEITVTFSNTVTVTGTPHLALETGPVSRTATYIGGSGSNTLTFLYTTQAGDESADLDYIATNALALNGGAIKRGETNAVLTLPSPGAANSLSASKAIVIAAFPTVSLSVGSASIAEAAETSIVTAALSQTSSQDVTVTLSYSGTATSGTDYNNTASTTITIPAESLSANAATGITAIQDADTEGNETIVVDISGVSKGFENGVQQQTITILDDDIPAVTNVSSSTANGTYKAGDVIAVTVTFSHAVTVTDTPQLLLETGTTDRTINYASGSGTTTLTFNYTVLPGDTSGDLDYVGTDSLTLNGGTVTNGGLDASLVLPAPGSGSSLAGNKAIVVDTTVPTASIVVADTALKAGETSLVTITFSEAVIGFTNAELTVANGFLSAVSSADGGSTYTATFTPTADIEAATNVIALDNTRVTDAAGNTGAGTVDSNTYAIDTRCPTVSSVAVPGNRTYIAGENLEFSVNFDDNVTVNGTPRIALVVGSTTLYAVYSEGSGRADLKFVYTVGTGQNDKDGITVDALSLNGGTINDAAGNAASLTLNSVGSTAFVYVDGVVPPVPSVPDLATASDMGTSGTDNITNDTTPTLTGTAEANSTVTLYDTDGITVLGTATATGGDWSITASALADGTHTITAKTTDIAGNTSAASTGLSITIDATRPTATIVMADTDLMAGDEASVTITFSKAVTNFTNADLTASNGSLSAVNSSDGGITFTATFTANNIDDDTNSIAVDLTGAIDTAGNNGTGTAVSANYTIAMPAAPGAPASVTATAANEQATVSFTPPTSNGGAKITGYTVTSSPGGITATGTASPITVTGLTNGTAYTFTVSATNSAGTGAASAASAAITPYAASSDDGPSTPTTPQSTAVVEVNGEPQSAGTSASSTKTSGQTVTTVTVDTDKLNTILKSKGTGATVTIPVTTGSDIAAGVLTGDMVDSMEENGATFVIQTEIATYTLPAAEININAVSERFGENVTLADIEVTVSIAEPSEDTVTVVENAAEDGGFTLVVPAVDFTISCSYNGTTVDVSNFNSYVERTIAIPEGVDPSKITTGVVVKPDGTTHHVPTRVTVIDGKYYAVINSLTNSTYAVVWHPVEFVDVTNHWAKDAINDMGSRMVVNGVDEKNYASDRNITRAEFAAIIVRALGLESGMGENPFGDVKSSDWYCGYIETASVYEIINGYNNGNFGPNDTITRQQAMVMIARAMKITGLTISLTGNDISALLGAYTDGAFVSDYAKDCIAACLKTGITSGTGNAMISPKDYITRAEVAVMVQRLLQKSGLI